MLYLNSYLYFASNTTETQERVNVAGCPNRNQQLLLLNNKELQLF